jgi:hypothetical protein
VVKRQSHAQKLSTSAEPVLQLIHGRRTGRRGLVITRWRPVGHANESDVLSRWLYNVVLVERRPLVFDEMNVRWVGSSTALGHSLVKHIEKRSYSSAFRIPFRSFLYFRREVIGSCRFVLVTSFFTVRPMYRYLLAYKTLESIWFIWRHSFLFNRIIFSPRLASTHHYIHQYHQDNHFANHDLKILASSFLFLSV